MAIKLWNGKLSTDDEQRFIREVQIVQRLNTPRHVPQFYGACLEGGQACLVMEHCALGSLYDYLPSHPLTPVVQHQLAISLAQALQFLHQKKITHRDLKSANILLVTKDSLLQVKITDFGLSKAQYPSIASGVDVSRALAWCAPEVLQGEKATYASDVFSAGMILWEIFTGRRPFTGRISLKEWIVSGKRESCEGIPDAYAALITRCWASNPHERPSATELATILQTMPVPEVSVPKVKEVKHLTLNDFSLPVPTRTEQSPRPKSSASPQRHETSPEPSPAVVFPSVALSITVSHEKSSLQVKRRMNTPSVITSRKITSMPANSMKQPGLLASAKPGISWRRC